jgi:hypothetical protein
MIYENLAWKAQFDCTNFKCFVYKFAKYAKNLLNRQEKNLASFLKILTITPARPAGAVWRLGG